MITNVDTERKAEISIVRFAHGITLMVMNPSSYSLQETSKTISVFLTNEEIEALRQRLPKPEKEAALLDKATEALLSRLIGERIEAQMALRTIELTGFQCSVCGTHTQVHR